MRFLSAAAVVFGLFTSVGAFAKPIEVVLNLYQRVSMQELAANVTDPTSPRYGQFYTPEEIRDLAGPAQAEYDELLDNLAHAGLTVTSESKTHLMVTVKGEPSTFEATFGARIVSLDGVRRSLEGPVKVPAALRVVRSVLGLASSHRRQPRLQFVKGLHADATGVTPQKIRTMYGFNALYSQGLSGAGQHIAIATYDDIYLDDMNAYFPRHQISPAPTIDQVKFNGDPTYSDQLSDVETAIDVQFSGALAPKAAIHVFTSAHNDDPGELQMFTAILDDNRAKVANYSWGECETDVTPAHQAEMDVVFNRAVAQGVNLTVASGDSGAYCTETDTPVVMADWPAAHPSVVAVGGTKVSPNASTLTEVAWSYSAGAGGTGGGVSTLWALPAYQSSFQAPYTKRSYPDISFNADPASGQAGYVRITPFGTHADQPTDFVLGGTSIAAPQWAGFLALVGEAREKAGRAPLGFLNPILYSMTPGDQTTLLHPILSGQNGPYSAGPGWNAVCGWGSLHANVLLPYLVSH